MKTDPTTGRSRGFAFVVFKEQNAVEQVLAQNGHTINGKTVDPKRAKAKTGKIFVGGLPSELSDDEIKAHFSQFGKVHAFNFQVDVEFILDSSVMNVDCKHDVLLADC